MPSNFKLALIFAKLAKEHGAKVLHGGDLDLLTKDLGDALRRQKKAMQDPDMGPLETTYELLPLIAEVKILTVAVSRKMQLDTKGKPTIAVLEDIVRKTEERKSASAKDIKDTLEWTRDFFSKPEIQEILQADLVSIDMPRSFKDIGKAFGQSSQRLSQEFGRLQAFLTKAKEPPQKPGPTP